MNGDFNVEAVVGDFLSTRTSGGAECDYDGSDCATRPRGSDPSGGGGDDARDDGKGEWGDP